MSVFVLVIANVLHLSVLPYQEEYNILNRLENYSLFVSTITFTSGLLYFDDESIGIVKMIIIVYVISANLLFTLGLLVTMMCHFYLYVKQFMIKSKIVGNDDYWLDVMRKCVKYYYKKYKAIILKLIKHT